MGMGGRNASEYAVTSNGDQKVAMRTGVKTPQIKAITYDMIRYAFDTLSTKGSFDSMDFRIRFNDEQVMGMMTIPTRYITKIIDLRC